MSFSKLILLLYLINICLLIESKKLKLVFVVHRHGDRTPITSWPTNPYGYEKKYWPDGFGQLNNKGKQRMYAIGKYIRKRYKHFLSDNPREVYVRSSEKERCLESVSVLLSGLYPPVNRWKWDNNLGKVWQPFPIHTMNISHDGLLCPEAICPTAQKETQRVFASNTIKKFHQKHKDLINLIEEKSGLKYSDYYVGRDMFSTLDIQRLNGLRLPDWVNHTVFQQIEHLSDMAFYFDAITPLQHRLRAGLLLKEMIGNIERSIKDLNFGYKIFLYSTHDTYVSVFLGALKVFNKKSPPFGATVFLEFYELSNNSYELHLYYLNETTTERPHRLDFDPSICGKCNPSVCEDCYKACPLDQFLESTKDMIPDNWEEECNRQNFNFKFRTKVEL